MNREYVQKINELKGRILNMNQQISYLDKEPVTNYNIKHYEYLERIYNNILILSDDVHKYIKPDTLNRRIILDDYYTMMKNFNNLLYKISRSKPHPIVSYQFELYEQLYKNPITNKGEPLFKDEITKEPALDIIKQHYSENFKISYLDKIFTATLNGLKEYENKYTNGEEVDLFYFNKKKPGIFFEIEIDKLIYTTQIYNSYKDLGLGKRDRNGNLIYTRETAIKLPNDGFFYSPTSDLMVIKKDIKRHGDINNIGTWVKLDDRYINDIPEINKWCTRLISIEFNRITDFNISSTIYYNYMKERIDIIYQDNRKLYTIMITFEPESLPFYFTDVWLNKSSFTS